MPVGLATQRGASRLTRYRAVGSAGARCVATIKLVPMSRGTRSWRATSGVIAVAGGWLWEARHNCAACLLDFTSHLPPWVLAAMSDR